MTLFNYFIARHQKLTDLEKITLEQLQNYFLLAIGQKRAEISRFFLTHFAMPVDKSLELIARITKYLEPTHTDMFLYQGIINLLPPFNHKTNKLSFMSRMPPDRIDLFIKIAAFIANKPFNVYVNPHQKARKNSGPHNQVQFSPEPKQKFSITRLHKAAAIGNNAVVTQLLKDGEEINAQDSNNQTPLHYAARNGHVTVVKTLCKVPGICIDAQDKSSETPLHKATKRANLVVIKVLLEANADSHIANVHGNLAIDLVPEENFSEVSSIFKYHISSLRT